MIVLVTGGAGYIGSHAVQRLLRDDHRVIAVDNLDRGHIQAIHALTAIAQGHLSFVQADIAETKTLTQVMRARKVDAVMHFAALAYVGESVDDPLRFYRNNAAGALSVLEAVDAAGVRKFVFSSTCATYGKPKPRYIPIPETCPQAPINPYGRSKLQVEQMLFDYAASAERAGKPFSFAALRYFNVAGSDRTGVLGEHHDPETHLIPIILQAMLGLRENVTIFGTNYDTPDGTCIRDYVHVEDSGRRPAGGHDTDDRVLDDHVLPVGVLDGHDVVLGGERREVDLEDVARQVDQGRPVYVIQLRPHQLRQDDARCVLLFYLVTHALPLHGCWAGEGKEETLPCPDAA